MKYLDFLSKKRYSRNVVIPMLKQLGYEKKAKTLEFCGNYKDFAVCTNCGRTHFESARSCKNRFCPVCQKKRALLWITKIYPVLEDLIQKGYIINFVTLTVPNSDNLQDRVDLLYNAFRYMQHEDKTTRRDFNNLYIGGVRSLEVKKGAFSNLWHPHLHMLVCKKTKSDFRKDREILGNAWSKAMTMVSGINYGPKDLVFDIKSIYYENNGKKYYSKKAVFKACLEVFKYLIKSDFEELACKELVETMARVRSIVPWGNFRELLHDNQIDRTIEKELDMKESELSAKVCSLCGGEDFIQISNVSAYGHKIYDFKEKKG